MTRFNKYSYLFYLMIIAIILFFLFKYFLHCGYFSTHDPRIFGPYLWKAFHIIAYNYPSKPSLETQSHAIDFISSLPFMLPCEHCGYHLQQYLMNVNLNIVTQSKTNMIQFFVDAHNNVSSHVHPNRKPFTVEQANKQYSKEFKCIFNKITWSDDALVR